MRSRPASAVPFPLPFRSAAMPTPTPDVVREVPRLAPRDPDANKGDFGRVLIVADSRGMSGAALLCAAVLCAAAPGSFASLSLKASCPSSPPAIPVT
jgi:hypothetical protein